MTQQDLLKFVAKNAMANWDNLAAEDRECLLEGLALILPADEARAAMRTAEAMRESEQHQLKFRSLILPES